MLHLPGFVKQNLLFYRYLQVDFYPTVSYNGIDSNF